MEAERARLNALYDAYAAKHGILNSRANAAALKQDSSYPLLCALEILDGEGNFERKADMFSKRTIRPNAPVTHADDPQAALAASLSERGRVDLPYMARLTGMGEKRTGRSAERRHIPRSHGDRRAAALAARPTNTSPATCGRSCASPS